MKSLLLAAALVTMISCACPFAGKDQSSAPAAPVVSNGPRFAEGDRVMTPSGPGTITSVRVYHRYTVKLDAKNADGEELSGSWSEMPDQPFDGVKKLEQ